MILISCTVVGLLILVILFFLEVNTNNRHMVNAYLLWAALALAAAFALGWQLYPYFL